MAQHDVTATDVESFLEYAAMFLCNLGNFYVSCELFLLIHILIVHRVKATRSLSLILQRKTY